MNSANAYPDKLRRIRYRDRETGKQLTFLTNHFELEAHTVADLYKCRWQVELFFQVDQAASADKEIFWHF